MDVTRAGSTAGQWEIWMAEHWAAYSAALMVYDLAAQTGRRVAVAMAVYLE